MDSIFTPLPLYFLVVKLRNRLTQAKRGCQHKGFTHKGFTNLRSDVRLFRRVRLAGKCPANRGTLSKTRTFPGNLALPACGQVQGASLEHELNSVEQLRLCKGFGQIIIGSSWYSSKRSGTSLFVRKHNDRDVSRFRIRLHPLEHFDSCIIWHQNVKDQEIEIVLDQLLKRVPPIFGSAT